MKNALLAVQNGWRTGPNPHDQAPRPAVRPRRRGPGHASNQVDGEDPGTIDRPPRQVRRHVPERRADLQHVSRPGMQQQSQYDPRIVLAGIAADAPRKSGLPNRCANSPGSWSRCRAGVEEIMGTYEISIPPLSGMNHHDGSSCDVMAGSEHFPWNPPTSQSKTKVCRREALLIPKPPPRKPEKGLDLAPRSPGKEDSYKLETFCREPCG